MDKLPKETAFLEKLRSKYFVFNSLPNEIDLSTIDDNEEAKPILLATVDDIAFAKQSLAKEIQEASKKLESLNQLHDMARDLGAKGADYALDYLKEKGESI